jgi:hypothetical protein
MNLVHSAKYAFLALGLCAGLSACGDDTNNMPTQAATFAQVTTDMKSLCSPCHLENGGTALTKFIIKADNTATYNLLMTNSLINKSAPEMSTLILAGKGTLMVQGAPHVQKLSTAQADKWTGWIKAGAANN